MRTASPGRRRPYSAIFMGAHVVNPTITAYPKRMKRRSLRNPAPSGLPLSSLSPSRLPGGASRRTLVTAAKEARTMASAPVTAALHRA